jgi:hypothetical protein
MTPEGREILNQLPGWAQFDPMYRAAAHIAAKESALLRERLGAIRDGLTPIREGSLLLEAWEALVKLPRNPAGKSTAERWAAVIGRLRRAIEDPSGLSWVAHVTEQIGEGWTYLEEAPNIIRVTVPWAPGSERFLLAERVLERMKPAAWRLILESAEGFVLDKSKLDKEPFHPV